MSKDEHGDILAALDRVIAERRDADPDSSYVAGLLRDGPARISRKLGEEAVETVIAGLSEDDRALSGEVADLWFHSLVLLASRGLDSRAVLDTLHERFGLSGIEEKKRRKN